MQKILVVSDTHGKLDKLKTVIERQKGIDRLIHLGDSEGQHRKIIEMAGCPVNIVRGNCDCAGELPNEDIVEAGSHRLFITHGHRYQISFGTETLLEAAQARNADYALFGHTHIPYAAYTSGVTLLNPGSISRPRQSEYMYTYMLLELDDEGEMHYTLCKV